MGTSVHRFNRFTVPLLGAAILLFQSAHAAELPPAFAGPVDFARDIQPILQKHCSECHGESKQKASYRVDQKEIALQGGDSGKAAVIPGKSAESHLIQLVSGQIEDEIMPPKGEKLSADQIGKLRAWIDSGAAWPEVAGAAPKKKHWAFIAPERPAPPQGKRGSWVRNPIDHFVLAKLESEKLKPSPEADRITLLRRLSLDLIGLPPTPAEVDQFLADKSNAAYERQVERLLASPHYGERWGRHWLDAARYADSNGYEKDQAREAWHYRDWVINAINNDLPYDRFIIEQLAGDLLPGSTQEQRVATGFLRNSMINEEGAIDPEQYRMDSMFDRMDAIGKSVLGLTIQCAQCHNHKYDPISQEEYFRMFSFINNDDELTAQYYSPEQLAQRVKVREEVTKLENQLKVQSPDWKTLQAQWEKSIKTGGPEWKVFIPVEHGDPGGLSKLQMQKDHSLLAGGHRFSGGTWRIRGTTPLTQITAVRMELLTNGNLPFFGPGRSGLGLFALREFTLEVAPADDPAKKTKVKFKRASADFEQPQTPAGDPAKTKETQFYGPVAFAIDGNDKTAWTIDAGPTRRNTDRQAVFVAEEPFGFPQGSEVTIHLSNHDEVACFRLSFTTAADPSADPVPKRVRDSLAVDPAQRSAGQQAEIFSYFRTTQPGWKSINDQIEAAWKTEPEAVGTTLVLQPRPSPRDTTLLKRGDWLKPGKPVTPGTPSFLHAMSKEAPVNRLGFAQWMVDPKSPTTARVLVNRVWQNYFGIGLVSTSEDFGVQSEAPSHPELLDWLAVEFMEPSQSGKTGTPAAAWSLKHLHRLIVHSATYRQSSKIEPELYERDQYNRLLARGTRLRVEGEIVRDIALAVSGLLSRDVGGASVYSPAPAFLFTPPVSYVPFAWTDATGAARYRRALYTFRRRSTPYPMLQNFDTPNADASCVRRLRSNTPLQALTTLNEPVFLECAQNLAKRSFTEAGKSDVEKITFIFRETLSRSPSRKELSELSGLLERQRAHFAQGWNNPRPLATGKDALPADWPKDLPPTQLAAYTALARVVLNLDETITKE